MGLSDPNYLDSLVFAIVKKDFIQRTNTFINEFRSRGYQNKEIRKHVSKFTREVPFQFFTGSRRSFIDTLMEQI